MAAHNVISKPLGFSCLLSTPCRHTCGELECLNSSVDLQAVQGRFRPSVNGQGSLAFQIPTAANTLVMRRVRVVRLSSTKSTTSRMVSADTEIDWTVTQQNYRTVKQLTPCMRPTALKSSHSQHLAVRRALSSHTACTCPHQQAIYAPKREKQATRGARS